MKLALIPPLDHLNDLAKTNYQLMLPQLASDPTYLAAYKEATVRSDYVILDNGVAEGKPVAWSEITALAQSAKVSEIVLPDVMCDAEGTFEATKAVWKSRDINFRYMYVAQGASLSEAFSYVVKALDERRWISTIGIPRHLVKTVRFDARLRLAEMLEALRESGTFNFQIHFLGTNSYWMQEVKYVEAALPGVVRGVDTSAPYVYSYLGGTMCMDAACDRYDGYFTRPFREGKYPVADEIKWLKEWCNYS